MTRWCRKWEKWWPTPALEEKHCHHAKSALAPRLRRMNRWGSLARCNKLNSWWRKVQPGCTIEATCDRCPSSDSISFLVHDFLEFQDCNKVSKHWIFPTGNWLFTHLRLKFQRRPIVDQQHNWFACFGSEAASEIPLSKLKQLFHFCSVATGFNFGIEKMIDFFRREGPV